MKIKPLGDRIIVKALEKEETVGGIIIPDTAKEKPQEGKVEAVGPGKLNDSGSNIPMNVKVGDSVLYGKYSGTEIKLDGEEYLIMHDDYRYAIYDNGAWLGWDGDYLENVTHWQPWPEPPEEER